VGNPLILISGTVYGTELETGLDAEGSSVNGTIVPHQRYQSQRISTWSNMAAELKTCSRSPCRGMFGY